MTREFSPSQTAAHGAHESGEEPLVALTITHASLATPIRIVNAAGDVTKSGNTFAWWPFRVTLPSESRDEIGSVRLTLDAADRSIGDAIRALAGEAPSIVFEIVLASSPDVTESGPFYFDLRTVMGDAASISGELTLPAILDEPAFERMTPATHPALFDS